MNIIQKPVKNFSPGRVKYRPQAIVIHIAQGTLQGAYNWFNTPSSKASSHYMVGKSGAIWQFVKERDTAWHAGAARNPSWNKLKPGVNPNLYTIGIEHEGYFNQKWSNQMYNSSTELVADICKRYGLKANKDTIIGHYRINSVTRSTCPGSGVNLDKFIIKVNQILENPKVIAELKTKINNLEKKISTLEGTVKSKNKRIRELEDRNASLVKTSNATKEVKAQNDALRKEVKDIQEINEGLTDKIIELEERIENLENEPSDNIEPNNSGSFLEKLKNLFS